MNIILSDRKVASNTIASNAKSGALLGEALRSKDDFLNIDWLVTLVKIDHLDTTGKMQVLGYYYANYRSEASKRRVLRKLKEIGAGPGYIEAIETSVPTDLDSKPDNFQKYDTITLMEVYKFLKNLKDKDQQKCEYMGRLFGHIYYKSNPSVPISNLEKHNIFKRFWISFLDLVYPKKQIVNVNNTTDTNGVDICLVSVCSPRDFSKIDLFELYGHYKMEDLVLKSGYPVVKSKD